MVFKFELKETFNGFKCNVKYPQVLLFTFTYNNIKKDEKDNLYRIDLVAYLIL